MTASPSVAIDAIGQIAINVHDLERATAFYRDALGLQHLFSAPNLAFFDCGGVRLMLGVAERPEFDHPSSILYFRVDDARDAHQRLADTVEFVEPPACVHKTAEYDLWIAAFRDGEGNTLAFMSEVAPGS